MDDNLHVVDVALRLAAVPVAGADRSRLFTAVCRELAGLLRVAAVVVYVPGPGWMFGSDETAVRVAWIQHRAAAGPLVAAAGGGGVSATADLARADPPELAALARDVGLGAAITAPLPAVGTAMGALAVLGVRGQQVTREHLAEIAPVLAVLAARLQDAAEFERLRATAPDVGVERAIGVLAGRHRVPLAEAARLLHERAAALRCTLPEAAAAVLVGPQPGSVPAPRADHDPPTSALGAVLPAAELRVVPRDGRIS